MSATLPINTCRWLVRPDGEMDITTVFGTVGPSSILGRGTKKYVRIFSEAGMVQW